MSRALIYDRAGNPMTEQEWSDSFPSTKDGEFGNTRRVGLWVSADGEMRVSTVWLGLDHGFMDEKKIFETMIFGGEHDSECARYPSEEQALYGHHQATLDLLLGRVPWFLADQEVGEP